MRVFLNIFWKCNSKVFHFSTGARHLQRDRKFLFTVRANGRNTLRNIKTESVLAETGDLNRKYLTVMPPEEEWGEQTSIGIPKNKRVPSAFSSAVSTPSNASNRAQVPFTGTHRFAVPRSPLSPSPSRRVFHYINETFGIVRSRR